MFTCVKSIHYCQTVFIAKILGFAMTFKDQDEKEMFFRPSEKFAVVKNNEPRGTFYEVVSTAKQGHTDRPMDGRNNGQIDRQTNGITDGQTNRPTSFELLLFCFRIVVVLF